MLALALSRSGLGTPLQDDVRDQRRGARKFPNAERLPGTLIMREVDEPDFADTVPGIGCPQMK